MCSKTTDCSLQPSVEVMNTYSYAPSTLHVCYFFLWRCGPTRAMASSFMSFLDHTQRPTTVGRTPLDEWSARRIDLYLTTYNTHNRQTSMPPVGFEPTISAGKRPQIYSLDGAATGTGLICLYGVILFNYAHTFHIISWLHISRTKDLLTGVTRWKITQKKTRGKHIICFGGKT